MNDPGLPLYAYVAGVLTGLIVAMVLVFYFVPSLHGDHHEDNDR